MRESDLLQHIYRRAGGSGWAEVVEVGPGDDTAVIRPPLAPRRVLITTDQLVEGRHYDPRTATADQIARKAIGRSLSDIAAMAGRPIACVAAAALGPAVADPDAIFDRMDHWAGVFGCPLVGGDIAATEGASVFTVTVLGSSHAVRGPVLRSGARPGDSVWVTGRFGGSLRSGRHLDVTPRLVEAAYLAETYGARLTSMIDVSDGLGRDAGRIAAASGVRIVMESARIRRWPDVSHWMEAARDGEDYELIFTLGSEAGVPPSVCPGTDTALACIGRVVAGSGCIIRDEAGNEHEASELGWDHET